jgi:hypothetical protein
MTSTGVMAGREAHFCARIRLAASQQYYDMPKQKCPGQARAGTGNTQLKFSAFDPAIPYWRCYD